VGTAPPQLETRENLAPQRSLSGRSTQFTSIVRRVQIGLLGQGLYEGAIDGVVGPQLRSAIRAFQSQTGLQITGTITPEVLDALRVSSQ
jgi:His-Xaa-Ser repeat protein HxsA